MDPSSVMFGDTNPKYPQISLKRIKKSPFLRLSKQKQVLIEVKDKLPNKALQNWEERTIRQGQEKNKKTKNTHLEYEQK
jgi:hypothetical protein